MNLQNTPNTTPEITPVGEHNTQTGVENTPIAEQITNTPTLPPVIPVKAGIQTVDPGSFGPTQNDDDVGPTEISDLSDADVPDADKDWIGQVKEVIKNDAEQPYKEEEDAELLNEAYMKQRFNVDIDAPIEEK